MESDGRKHPVHAPVYERHNTPIIIFLTVVRKTAKRFSPMILRITFCVPLGRRSLYGSWGVM